MTIRRWLGWSGGALGTLVLAALAIFGIFELGLVQQWARHALIDVVEQRTGTKVELGDFHLHIWDLQAEIENFTAHGTETAGTPLFHADRVHVTVRVISFFSRRIALNELTVDQPEVNIQVDKAGHSNIPSPKAKVSNTPWQESLFSLQISRLALRDGSLTINDRKIPLVFEARNFDFALNYNSPLQGADSYVGNLRCQQALLADGTNLPFRSDISMKFELYRDAFDLEELVWKLPHSDLNLRAELSSFKTPTWSLRYRGRLSLADVRSIFRAPTTPGGLADFSGEAHYASAAPPGEEWTASGYFKGHDIRMPYTYFHASGLETWGNYEVAHQRLAVANLNVRALAGALDGRLEMEFHGLTFRTETHYHDASLGAALAAVDNPNLPVHTLHWDGLIDVDSVNTWTANFKHFRTTGKSEWHPSPTSSPGVIPVGARIAYDYSTDLNTIFLTQSQISTPRAEIDMDGPLSAKDSALEVKFRADDLLEWDDFINIIRGSDALPQRIAGAVMWNGRILGPLVGPTFVGHMNVRDPQYGNLYWNQIDGDMEYSPDRFRLTSTVLKRGGTSAKFDLGLQFDGNWGFLPQSEWTLEGSVEDAPSQDFQDMFGTNYPVRGIVTGQFQGSGTRGSPVLAGTLSLDKINARGVEFDRLTTELHLDRDEVRLSHAELRKGAGSVTGEFSYRIPDQSIAFDLSGRQFPLETIRPIQTTSLPVAGQLDFHLQGNGPLRAPVAQGELHLVNLKLGAEIEGNFAGQLVSDGRNARVSFSSELSRGKLQGQVALDLSGNQMLSGNLTVQQFDLDPLIVAGLHLKQLTSHSSTDGSFKISGTLRQPESIEVDADISRITFDYESVQLVNEQDIRITYHSNEVRIEQAHLHGADTDLSFSGSARFDRDQTLRFMVSGSADLRLAQGFLPELVSQGRADVNVSVSGTVAHPRIVGRAGLHDGAAHYGDFPIGVSKANGELVFDTSRLVFDGVTAEAGGGQLRLSGSLTYGEGPLRYQVTAATSTLRIRYPVGMSWLAGGTLQLSGTSTAALLSGRVDVQRLLFAQGTDVASFLAVAAETTAAPVSNSAFLRNLSFDVEAQTTAGARIEWTGAEIEMDGNIRLRGSWDRPILLGNIHLLGGQMPFRGNTYQLTRGDINFSNPFRLDPVLNVEATSTISQYQVTIDFSGSASHLALNYRSDPPLPETDIIGLLALGRTGQETGPVSQAASQNYGATALLSEAISSGLGGRIEHLFGISQFRVDPFVAGTATESNAAARITIEQQVKNNLTITYSSNAATSNQYQLIQVEYAVKRDLSVVFLRDINGTYGFDIKWIKRHK